MYLSELLVVLLEFPSKAAGFVASGRVAVEKGWWLFALLLIQTASRLINDGWEH